LSALARATAVMSLGTVLSRVTGLARITAITAALGIVESRRLPDTYNLGNVAPNILYELLLGGILTSVFVPVFVELLEKEGQERAWRVASAMINLSTVFLLAMTTLGILAAPLIAKFYSVRAGEEAARQQEVLTFLLRLFLPQIIFYALAALTAGLLNAHKRFGPPMYTPVLNNLAVIVVFVAFRQAYDRVTLETVTTPQLLLIGLGTTAGVALMAVAQLPFLRGLGHYSFNFSLQHPSIRKLAGLSVFVVGYVAANQIGYLIVQRLANAQNGAFSAYVTAFTFFLLPHGLFAVSVITALLPGMSEMAVNERWSDFRARLSTGVRSTLFLILPAAVGYFVLGEAIVRLLLQYGIVTERSTTLVASVLRFFVLGLLPFSIFQLFLRAFYALQDTRTPFLINCAAVALNVAINIAMFGVLGVQGLAAGHAVAYLFGAVLQGVVLSKRIGGLDSSRVSASALKIGAAATGMGVVVWLSARGVESLAVGALFGRLLSVGVPVAAGVVAYVALAALLRVEELNLVKGIVGRRLAR
jgi:putative peptidoglycan lipid II flippase